jgi:hypothetical protein
VGPLLELEVAQPTVAPAVPKAQVRPELHLSFAQSVLVVAPIADPEQRETGALREALQTKMKKAQLVLLVAFRLRGPQESAGAPE